MKLYYMPKTVLEAISAFEDDEQFGFANLPMPSDLNISAKNAGKKEVVYNVLPGKPRALAPAELEEFKAKRIDEVVSRLLGIRTSAKSAKVGRCPTRRPTKTSRRCPLNHPQLHRRGNSHINNGLHKLPYKAKPPREGAVV